MAAMRKALQKAGVEFTNGKRPAFASTYIGRLSFSESSFLIRFHARGPKCQLQSFLPPWSSFARFNE